MNCIEPSKLKAAGRFFGGLFLLGALLAALLPSQASACGGFFCSQSAPINQAAERIIFSKNDDGTVTTIVEILYEGEAEGFAWVLPVPGEPVVDISSTQAFDGLQAQTNPRYQLNRSSSCNFGGTTTGATTGAATGSSTGTTTGGTGPTVVVLDAGIVGALEYETISVDAADEDPADVAIRWLSENGYDTGTLGADVLRPYLANGLNLIAFKLTKGASAGSIRPVSLTYEATVPAIPIVPTSVAANDDMGVLVWVLGKNRAVPTNYRSLELNEARIDWFTSGNYNDVVTAAADEAGGQGFVTESASPILPEVTNSVGQPAVAVRQAVEGFRGQPNQLLAALVSLSNSFGNMDGYLDAVREEVNLRDGVTAEAYVACAGCYVVADSDDPILTTDLESFLSSVVENVVRPIEETAQLFDEQDYVTRLYTTMSGDEMTLDPVFEFNPDAPNVSNVHAASMTTDCSGNWKVELADGRIIKSGPAQVWPEMTEQDQPFNIRVLQFGVQGLPDIVVDNMPTSVGGVGIGDGNGTGSGTGDGVGASPGATGGDSASVDGDTKPLAPRTGGGCTLDAQGRPSSGVWFLLGLGLIAFGGLRRVRARR